LFIAGTVVTPLSAQPRFFVIPAGADPASYPSGTTAVAISPGESLCFEVWVSGDPTEVYSVEANLEDALGGTAGRIEIQCTSGSMNTSDPDFPEFTSGNPIAGVTSSNCTNVFPDVTSRMGYVVAGTAPVTDTAVIPTTGNYVGGLCYLATDGTTGDPIDPPAEGVFVANWAQPGFLTKFTDPNATPIPPESTTFDALEFTVVPCLTRLDCKDNDGNVCIGSQCIGGVCQYTPRIYGDIDGNGFISLIDLFCVLDGFSADFSSCTFEEDDIHGSCGGGPNCCPNGSITIGDLFAVLDAFGGTDPCCGG